jgi:hypothetical protein
VRGDPLGRDELKAVDIGPGIHVLDERLDPFVRREPFRVPGLSGDAGEQPLGVRGDRLGQGQGQGQGSGDRFDDPPVLAGGVLLALDRLFAVEGVAPRM